MPLLTWGSGAHLAVALVDQAPLVPVIVRYDPAICGPDVAHWLLRDAPWSRDTTWSDIVTADQGEAVRMDERSTRVGELLHEATEAHHQVFRMTNGVDDDWASWYAEWLVTLSDLPEEVDG